jgi:hypothetical protein
MRAINSAQSGYAATCGNGYYSPTLANLGAAPTAGGSPFLSPDVAKAGTVTKSGYEIDMTATAAATAPATCNGLAAGAAGSGYNASATPISGGGSRSFATNTTGTIYQAYQTTVLTAGDNSAPTGGVPIQ